MFLVQILTVPAVIYHLEHLAVDSLNLLQTCQILQRSIALLIDPQSLKIIAYSMRGTQLLSLLANIVHLFYLEPQASCLELGPYTFTVI